MRDPRFVVIGGGTGISVLLRGLKRFSEEISAIVTMADDGGSSGMLRREYGMLPPGDVRNCLVALANAEPSLKNLLQYRFVDGELEGQNMGNLIIAALSNMYGGFAEGVREAAEVLRITGKVLPVTTENIALSGRMSDGATVEGESKIPAYGVRAGASVEEIRLIPRNPRANPDCIEAILRADILVLGPGSLYTSLIPNILVPEIARALEKSEAPLIYVANIMQQQGETRGMRLTDHLTALARHGLTRPVDIVLVNDEAPDPALIARYKDEEDVDPVPVEEAELEGLAEAGIVVERGDFLDESLGYVRHNGLLVAQRLLAVADRCHENRCVGRKSGL